ncbi:MAG: hypothetical protein KDB29_02155 [Planctomycetes bacterium]|nr:hypothetical protein [Planctomycetota bacterium]
MNEPWEILRKVVAAFQVLQIDYMIVGSTAMRAYVPGRSTFDTDVLVRMTEAQLAQLSDELGDDWLLEWEPALQALRSGRMFNAIHYGTSWKLDLIPLKDSEFHKAEFRRRQLAQIGEIACYVQSVEDLVVSKLHWAKLGGSKRQIEDVRGLLRSGLELDREYIRKWSADLGLDTLLAEADSG